MKRYSPSTSCEWLIFTRRGINIEQYPAVKRHLTEHFEKLRPRNNGELVGRKPGSYQWYEIQDNTAYFEQFSKPKIIWGELSDEAKFTYNEKGHYVEATTFLMTGDSLKFNLAILNSIAASWYFDRITTTSGMGTSRWKKYKIEQLPIPQTNMRMQKRIESLVDIVLSGKQDNIETSEFEAEIDALVFASYNIYAVDIELIMSDLKIHKSTQKKILKYYNHITEKSNS